MHSINPDAARAGGTALTPLVPLVRAVVADQRRRYEGSTITLKGASGDPRVALGENDLRSVVGNLVVNALEVSGGKGPVDVRLRSDADRVHLRVAPQANVHRPFAAGDLQGVHHQVPDHRTQVILAQRHPRVAGGALECDRGPLVAAPLVGHHRADERDQRREGRAARSSGVGVDGVHDGADALERAARPSRRWSRSSARWWPTSGAATRGPRSHSRAPPATRGWRWARMTCVRWSGTWW